MTRLLSPLLALVLSLGCSRHTPTVVEDATTAEPAIPTGSAEDYTEREVSDGPGSNLDQTADRITGKVIRIADGDTLTILDADNEQVKVRFNGIDAPEKALSPSGAWHGYESSPISSL